MLKSSFSLVKLAWIRPLNLTHQRSLAWHSAKGKAQRIFLVSRLNQGLNITVQNYNILINNGESWGTEVKSLNVQTHFVIKEIGDKVNN